MLARDVISLLIGLAATLEAEAVAATMVTIVKIQEAYILFYKDMFYSVIVLMMLAMMVMMMMLVMLVMMVMMMVMIGIMVTFITYCCLE